MARRIVKHLKNRAQPQPARAAVPAKVASTVSADDLPPTPGVKLALDTAPNDARGPSLQAAERYRVDERNYTTREKRVAQYAQDFNGTSMNALTFTESTGFPGFPTLSLLAQLPEYRSMHERLADECIRMWGKVSSSGEASDQVKADIESELKRMDVKQVIRQMVIHDQAFGGAHVYFKLKGDEEFVDTPLVYKPYTVRKNSFEGLRVVEPYWVTPNYYNSIDPSAADFYKPSSWFMIGKEVHATRLQTIISRPVPDMLKPTYSFRGVSMSQLAMPYIDNWLRTRQSVSDTIKQFSVSGVLMDLQQSLLPGAQLGLRDRAELINIYRDNRNLLLLDKATEEFFQVNTPLSGLDALQAQAQEQMSAVCHIPLVVLLGITPTGLNASSEGEIRVFYDFVKGYQQNTLTSIMMNVIRLIQLSKFGAIDEDIAWTWEPLHELTSLEQSELRKNDSETDERYVALGVVAPETVQRRLNADASSLYSGMLEAGDTMETTPDEDIATITEHLINDVPADGGAPVVGNVGMIDPDAAQPQSMGAPTALPLDGTENDISDLNMPGLPALQAGVASDPTITDPTETADPGVLELHGIADGLIGTQPVAAPAGDDPFAALNSVIATMAMDAHWVTAKPNGPDNKGTPLLIGNGGKVVGGAGGKLNGAKKGGKGAKGGNGKSGSGGAGGGKGEKEEKSDLIKSVDQLAALAGVLSRGAEEVEETQEELNKGGPI